jgi:LysM repeat protein
VREATQHVDPLVRRMGVLAVVVALLVPIALTLRSGGDDAALQPDPTALDTSLPGTDPGAIAPAETAAGNPFASIDVDALPEAVPVNPDPTQAPAPEADVASTSGQPAQAATPAITVAAARTEAVKTTPVCAAKYTVAAGDAWILIAKRAGVTTKALLAANGATTSTPLYPGRSICLPAGATTPTAPKVTTTTTKKVTTTTTTVKATTTTAAKVAPAKTYTRAQVEAIIREVWPDELENEAVRIATRESNLVPTAQNYCCTGLFQIYFSVHKSWLAKIGVTSAAQLKDPRVNAFAALVLYNRAGSWAPWRL